EPVAAIGDHRAAEPEAPEADLSDDEQRLRAARSIFGAREVEPPE
ncbi:MAG: hypothetical protein IRY97_10965, partial [Thermomicrobiaceae bacterium]|nr:hypothetical protein [Thermomicrobiaceae bacterium]